MILRLHPLALACLAASTSALAAPLELQETVITAKGYEAATQDIPQAIEVLQAHRRPEPPWAGLGGKMATEIKNVEGNVLESI